MNYQEQKTILDAKETGFLSEVDYTRPVTNTPIEGDLGLLGPQPNLIGGAQIGMQGAQADNIWTQQYSAGGSILDALLDGPQAPPQQAKKKKTPPPPPAGLKVQAQSGGGEGKAPSFFQQNPVVTGMAVGMLAYHLLNKYL